MARSATLRLGPDSTDVGVMDDRSVDPSNAAVRVAETLHLEGKLDADQPDPVTLCEPSFDDQGLLRWGAPPLLGGLGAAE